MEGVTDFATRLFFSLTSCPDEVSTPFLRVTQGFVKKRVPFIFAPEIFATQNSLTLPPYKTLLQIMGSQTDELAQFSKEVLDFVPFVELNCGCPSPKVIGHGAGSSILNDLGLMEQRLDTLCKSLGHQKLSLKMRTGFYHHDEFQGLINLVSKFPLAQLRIHGRTRPQRYQGLARWDLIEHAASICPFPVIASGDICDHSTYVERLQQAPTVSGSIVGRGAIRNPWIFEELRTGQQVRLKSETIVQSLYCFAIFQELQQSFPSDLWALAQNLWKLQHSQSLSWEEVFAECKIKIQEVAKDPSTEIPWNRYTLGRTKMFWNYFRSSLPESFFDPQIFRQNTVPDFFLALEKLVGHISDISLCYKPELDRFYSGASDA